MANISGFNFGFIIVDGKQYAYDVVILADGTVTEREASKARLGNHLIMRAEVEKLCRLRPETVIFGTGTTGMAKLAGDAEVYLHQKNVNVLLLPSAQAVDKFNQLVGEGQKVAALFHITC